MKMKNYYNSDEILLEKCEQFTLLKNKDYKEQIEHSLRVLAEVSQSHLPLLKYRYDIIAEFPDVVIVKMTKNGKIKVNE